MSKSWIIKGITRSIRIRNELFFSGNRDKYKVFRNKVCTFPEFVKERFILRKMDIGYILRHYLKQNVCNMKKTWEDIDALSNQ